MEKNIHTHLFAAALSIKENRLAFLAVGPEAFDADVKSVKEKLDAGDETKARAELAVIRTKGVLDKAQLDTLTDLDLKANKVAENKKKLTEADNTVKDAEWSKSINGIKGKDAATATPEAVTFLKAKVEFAVNGLEQAASMADTTDRPHNAALLAAAYNKILNEIKAADPENKVNIFEEKDNDTVANLLKEFETVQRRSLEDVNSAIRALEGVALAALLDIRKTEAKEKINGIKNNIWGLIENSRGLKSPNTPDLVQKYVGLIQSINAEQKRAFGAPNVVPSTPSKKIETPANSLKAVNDGKQIKITVDPKNADVKVTKPDGTSEVITATNGEIVLNSLTDGKYVVESGGTKIESQVSGGVPSAPNAVNAATATPAEINENTILGMLQKIFKALQDFIRENKGGVDFGRVNQLQAEIDGLKTQKAGLEAKGALKTPDDIKLIADINSKIIIKEAELAAAQRNNDSLFSRLRGSTNIDALNSSGVRIGRDGRGGDPYMEGKYAHRYAKKYPNYMRRSYGNKYPNRYYFIDNSYNIVNSFNKQVAVAPNIVVPGRPNVVPVPVRGAPRLIPQQPVIPGAPRPQPQPIPRAPEPPEADPRREPDEPKPDADPRREPDVPDSGARFV